MVQKSMFSKLRKHFLTGIFIFIPLIVIFWIFQWVFGFFWDLYEILPDSLRPDSHFISFFVALASGVAFFVFITVFGYFSELYLGKKFLKWLASVLQKIPVVGSIYSSLDQLIKAIASGGGKQFSRVVYVEYPRHGSWAIGFVTAAVKGHGLPEGHLNVFVPTVPNPTAGFLLMVPEADVRETNLKVDEAFKLILSLGIAQ